MRHQNKSNLIQIDNKRNAFNNNMAESSILLIASRDLKVYMKDNHNEEKKIQTKDSKNAIKT